MPKPKLTKAELVSAISDKIDISPRDAHEVLDLLLETLKAGLLEASVIELRGFGTFQLRTRKGRETARNPKTGEKLTIESHGTTVFRPGRELKDSTWGLRA